MKKTLLKYRIVILICCICLPTLTYAQPDAPQDAPLDGGVTLLLAAGAAYGVKKYKERKKKQEEDVEK